MLITKCYKSCTTVFEQKIILLDQDPLPFCINTHVIIPFHLKMKINFPLMYAPYPNYGLQTYPYLLVRQHRQFSQVVLRNLARLPDRGTTSSGMQEFAKVRGHPILVDIWTSKNSTNVRQGFQEAPKFLLRLSPCWKQAVPKVSTLLWSGYQTKRWQWCLYWVDTKCIKQREPLHPWGSAKVKTRNLFSIIIKISFI